MRVLILAIITICFTACAVSEENIQITPNVPAKHTQFVEISTLLPSETASPKSTLTTAPILSANLSQTATDTPTVYSSYDSQIITFENISVISRKIEEHEISYIRDCDWSFDSKQLAFATDGGVVIYALESQEFRLLDTASSISLAFSPDNNLLVASGDDRNIKIWNTNTTELIANRSVNWDFPPGTIIWSSDGNQVFLSLPVFPLYEGGIFLTVWDTNQWVEIESIETGASGLPNRMVLNNTDNILGTSSYHDLMVHYWDFPSMTLLTKFPGTSVTISPGGTLSAAADKNLITIMELPEFKEKLQIQIEEPVDSLNLTFSVDEKLVVSGGVTLEVWDLSNGLQIMDLGTFKHPISCLSFSPNGSYLLATTKASETGEYDSSFYLWAIE